MRLHSSHASPTTVAGKLRDAAVRALGLALARAEEVAPGLDDRPGRPYGLGHPTVDALVASAGEDQPHGGPGIGSIRHALLGHARGPVAVVPSGRG